jgi:ribosome-binding factor A
VTRRTNQLGEAIREEVANLIAHGLKDPRIGFVTITRAEVTPDLRFARVYFGVLGDKAQREKTLAGLSQAAGFIRREVGKRVRLRHVPELVFHYDAGLEATERVARLLEENPSAADPGDDPDTDE